MYNPASQNSVYDLILPCCVLDPMTRGATIAKKGVRKNTMKRNPKARGPKKKAMKNLPKAMKAMKTRVRRPAASESEGQVVQTKKNKLQLLGGDTTLSSNA